MPTVGDKDLALRAHSTLPEDHKWRRSLKAIARRLDGGESVSITIAKGIVCKR